MEQEQPNKFLIPLAIVVAGGLIAGAIYYGGGKPSTAYDQEPAALDTEVRPVNEADHILGSRSAKLTTIEYSDTECPYCKIFHSTMKEILGAYDNEVAWVYRHLPIPQLHAKAMKEAEATECVAELGGNQAFWNYLDKIFTTTNSHDSLDPGFLPKFAGEIGIDVAQFNNCLSSDKYEEEIRKSIEEGYMAGARGTPYSLIIDREGKVKGVINGAEPTENVKAKLDSLLN